MAAKQTFYDALLKAGFRKTEIHATLHRLVLRYAHDPAFQPASNIVFQHCKNYRFARGLMNARNARKPKNPV